MSMSDGRTGSYRRWPHPRGRRWWAILLVLAVSCSGTTSESSSDGADRGTSTSTTAPTDHDGDTTDPTTTAPTTTASETSATSTASSATTTSGKAGPGPLAGRVIVIDPGHNGGNGAHGAEIGRQVDAGGFEKDCNTTGTAAGGLSESRFNWEAAGVVKATLEGAGATVVLTRQSDDGVGPCVDVRGSTAGAVEADALISIHADGSAASNHGFHVIHPGPLAGYTDDTAPRSAQLAADLRDALVGRGWTTSTYLGDDGLDERTDLGTLNRSPVPSVMVECGNMRNSGDLALLRSAEGKGQLAFAIVTALSAFLG